MKKPISTEALTSGQDHFGRRLAACLDASAEDLPHDISERLRVARRQALSQYRSAQQASATPMVLAGASAVLGGGGDEERGVWSRVVALIPLLALIAGLVALQVLGSDQFTEELAEIDAAILTDDLPPDAYADPGFAQFLKSRIGQLKQD